MRSHGTPLLEGMGVKTSERKREFRMCSCYPGGMKVSIEKNVLEEGTIQAKFQKGEQCDTLQEVGILSGKLE